jgi:hypothetical protein
VQRARGEFLACAGRSDDQNAAVGGGDLFNDLAQLVDRRRLADYRRRHRRQLLERLHLALEPGIFQRPVGYQHQPVSLEGFLNEIIGAALDRRHGGFDIAVSGNHHHRHFRMLLHDRVEQLQAVEPAALQPDVQKYEVRTACNDRRQRAVAVGGRARMIALILQNAGYQLPDVVFVVDYKNIRCHV